MFAIQITKDGAHQALIVEETEAKAENAAFAWFIRHVPYSIDHAMRHEGYAQTSPYVVHHKWTVGSCHFRSLHDAAKQYASAADAARAQKEGAIHLGMVPPKTKEDETATLDQREGRWFIHVWEREA